VSTKKSAAEGGSFHSMMAPARSHAISHGPGKKWSSPWLAPSVLIIAPEVVRNHSYGIMRASAITGRLQGKSSPAGFISIPNSSLAFTRHISSKLTSSGAARGKSQANPRARQAQ